ncbi:SDR family oxidoreductase [Arcicella lustrica]|uniref:NmrA family NAD(P)-binding protein n=1 Tax=Arcicella lustrica TaxID=2984196 RepID=A0ABU5SPJ3_9BACT|nr:NmrA family NAD(P)-binding protein [Arcicella sp. DC25W]MEA5429230.1 NmrA family NAD(P)-binding protein [Arcicella sp. DC25W]
MSKKITVIGATGMIGIPVTKELVKAGFEITALVRNIEKAKQIFPTGVHFVKGDLQNKAEISEALENADAAYISISASPNDSENEFNPELHGFENILSALKTTSVKQVGFLSSFLARNYEGNWWVMNAKKQAINKIKKCGIPYTIFYPSNFMENFNGGMRDGNKINLIGKSNEKAWWIAGEDFGKQVAKSFETDKALNREYSVQGLEAMTTEEASKVYVENYTKDKLTIAKLPMGMARFLSLFIKPLKFVVPLIEVMNNNKETFEAQKTWDDLGKPSITLQNYAKE